MDEAARVRATLPPYAKSALGALCDTRCLCRDVGTVMAEAPVRLTVRRS